MGTYVYLCIKILENPVLFSYKFWVLRQKTKIITLQPGMQGNSTFQLQVWSPGRETGGWGGGELHLLQTLQVHWGMTWSRPGGGR